VPIAPRTFYASVVRAPSKRALWDATITEVLAGYYEPDEDGRKKPESLYGSVKMWAHLQREGIPVAKSTVERLMRRHGSGVATGSDGSPVRGGCTESAARGGLHLRQASHGGEGDPFGGPVAMRLGVGGSWSTVERIRLG
jgi:helix-turn-helix protein